MKKPNLSVSGLFKSKINIIVVVGAIVVIGVFSIVLSHAASVATLSLSAPSTQVPLGSDVTVTITENSNSDPVNAVESDLTYDQTKLKFDSIDTTTSAFTTATPSNSGGNGLVSIGRIILSQTPGQVGQLTGEQTVATVTFTSLTPGSTPITFADSSAIVQISDNTNVLSSTTGITLNITDTTAPSIPTGLAATSTTATSIDLGWTASTDNVGVTSYTIYRDGAKIGTSSSPSYNDTGLSPDKSYSYTVSASDAATNMSLQSAAVPISTMPDTTPPSAPTGLTATIESASTVKLSWTASTDNVGVTSYAIYRGTTAEGTTPLATTASTSYEDATVAAGTSYNYTVVAYDAANNPSARSNAATVTTSPIKDTTPPSAPTDLTAKVISGTQVNLSWNASTDNIGVTSYSIYRGTTKIGSVDALTYNDTTVAAGESYTYYVVAYDAAGNPSTDSNTTTATTPSPVDSTPPSVPTNASAKEVSDSEITLSWGPSTDNVGVTGYYILRSSGNAPANPPVMYTHVGATDTSFSDSNLDSSTAYNYQVEAYDLAGNVSSPSNLTSATTLAPPDKTPPTVSLTAPTAGQTVKGTVTLSATATDNVGVTKVEFLVDGQVLSTATSSPYTASWDTSAVTNATHTITAEAFDAANNSSVSMISITVNNGDTEKPTAPTDLAAILVPGTAIAPVETGTSTTNIIRPILPTTDAVKLTWNAATDNVGVTGYYILRSSGGGAPVTITQVSGSVLTYTDETVQPGITYTYQVEAFDAAKNVSNPSNTVSITTPPIKVTAPLPMVTNFQAVAVSVSQINLSWNVPVQTGSSSVAGFVVFRDGEKIATTTTTSYGDTGLKGDTKYSYYVEATDAAGNTGPVSSTSSATTFKKVKTFDGGDVKGQVTNSKTKQGLPNTFVVYFHDNKFRYTGTDSTGHYAFEHVPAGSITFLYYHPNAPLLFKNVKVVTGKTTVEDVKLLIIERQSYGDK